MDFEQRLRSAKKKQEELVRQRSDQLAYLRSSQERLKKLKDKAEVLGYSLKELPEVLEKKKSEISDMLDSYDEKLLEVERALEKYSATE